MPKRRAKGDGGVYQRHDHRSCPPLLVVGYDDEGGPVKTRANHRCQGRWTAQVDLGWRGQPPNVKRVRKTLYGLTKGDVQEQLRKALREKDAGQLVTRSPTMETWTKHWLEVICVERGLKVNTLKSHRSKVEQYIVPSLGTIRVDKLQPENVRAMYGRMREQGLSESTLRQTHAILRRALEVAVREGKASRNVAAVIDPPSTKTKKRVGLTLEQARKVLRAAGWGIPMSDAVGLRWYVALYLGMRQGECLALRWSSVNLDEEWVFVQESLVREPGVGLVFDTPKNAASVRYVPLPPVVLARFKVACAYHVANGGKVDDLVFSQSGDPIDHRRDWAAWRDLLRAAGVPHVALHAARNTAASLLEAARVPERMVGQILGQATIQVTRGYQHAELERLRDAMRLMESYVEQAPEQPAALPQ